MALIDTGLGWKCEEQYFCNNTDVFATANGYNDRGNQQFSYSASKMNNGPAVACVLTDVIAQSQGFSTDGATMFCVASTVLDNIKHYIRGTNSYNITSATWTITYQNLTFYLALSATTFPPNSVSPSSRAVSCGNDWPYADQILQAMGVTVKNQTIPVQYRSLEDTFDIYIS